MDRAWELDSAWELAPVISGLVVCACIAVGVLQYVVRRVTAPRRIAVPQPWMQLEQRRFFNPGALPRAVAGLLLSIVLVGGVIGGPFALGMAPGISWYLRVDWIIALFISIALSMVASYFLMRKPPRCPSCKSSALEKEWSLPPKQIVRIYLCRSCQIVWQTTEYPHVGGGDHVPWHHHHH
jgi:hypothetical protein